MDMDLDTSESGCRKFHWPTLTVCCVSVKTDKFYKKKKYIGEACRVP